MNEINSEMLIEKYETLIMVMEDLQGKLQTLTGFYLKVKDKYELYDSEVEKALAKIPSLTANATDTIVKQTDSAKSDLDAGIKEAKSVLRDITKVSKDLTALISEAKNMRIEVPDLEKRIAALEEGVIQGHKEEVSINTEEVISASEMWYKYHGKISLPIIVKMDSWTGDYCYVITDYDEDDDRVSGRVYHNGELYTKGKSPNGHRTFKGSTQFSFYISPNLEDIVESESDY